MVLRMTLSFFQGHLLWFAAAGFYRARSRDSGVIRLPGRLVQLPNQKSLPSNRPVHPSRIPAGCTGHAHLRSQSCVAWGDGIPDWGCAMRFPALSRSWFQPSFAALSCSTLDCLVTLSSITVASLANRGFVHITRCSVFLLPRVFEGGVPQVAEE